AAAGTGSRRLQIPRQVRAVVLDRAPETVAQTDAGPPAGRLRELRRVGVEAADVDALLLVGPRHVADAPGAGDLDQQLDQIAVRDRLAAPPLVDVARAPVAETRAPGTGRPAAPPH